MYASLIINSSIRIVAVRYIIELILLGTGPLSLLIVPSFFASLEVAAQVIGLRILTLVIFGALGLVIMIYAHLLSGIYA